MGKKFCAAALIDRAVVEVLESRRMLAAGVLDTSFNGTGKILATGGTGNKYSDVLVQASGKALAAGQISAGRFSVVRYNFNGTLDTSFGGGDGIVDMPAGTTLPLKLASDSTGRVIVAGAATTGTVNNALNVARFDANGNPDSTFGGTGFVRMTMAGLRQINAVAIQSDDKIVLGGTFFSSTQDFAILRLTTTGTLDGTFDGDGSVIIDNSQEEAIHDVTIMANGAILASGAAATDWAFIKLTNTGGRYSGFGTSGIAIGPVITTAAQTSIVALPDTSFFVAGQATNNASAFGHFTLSGKPDPVFGGGDGIVDLLPGSGFTDIVAQPDNKIIVTGASNGDFFIGRYLVNGSPDSTFGAGGSTTTNLNGTDVPTSLALAPDGRVVVGGLAGTQPAVARYTSQGLVNQLSDGLLHLTGSDALDTVIITPQSYGYSVTLNGVTQSVPNLKTRLAVALAGGNDTLTINGLTSTKIPPMSIDMGIGTDALTINGTGGDDAIELIASGFRASTTELYRTFTGVESLYVNGQSGEDTLTLTGAPPRTTLDGSFGNDILIVTGSNGTTPVTLLGGDGTDSLYVGFNSTAVVTLDGGAGTDSANYEGTAGNDSITLSATGISGRSFTELNLESRRVHGLEGNDRITSPSGIIIPVSLNGGDGDDIITAQNGTAEAVNGGLGNDSATTDTTDVVTNVEFFNASYISGVLFNDTDASGTQNGTEAAITGQTVYIDADNSGTLNAGDTSVTTTGSGYAFGNLNPGTYTIRQVLQTGWVQTFPTNSAAWTVQLVSNTPQTGKNFGTRVPPVSPPPPPPPPPGAQTPYFGSPFNITASGATIQAENFDNGGQNVSWFDTTLGNSGGQYRANVDPDIQPVSNDTGIYYIGGTKGGEWLEYTANITGGLYTLGFRVASNGAGGNFRVDVDGLDATGLITIPNTLGWNNWQTVSKSGVTLPGGQHIIRLYLNAAGATGSVGNFNYLTFTAQSASTTTTLTNSVSTYARDGGSADANFGSDPTLQVKSSSIGFNRESFLRFDLSSVATISSAKLRLFGNLSDATLASLATSIYSSTNVGWGETTLTYNNKPAVNSFLGNVNVSGTTGAWYELNITSFLQAEKAAGRNVVTFVLRNNTQSTPLTTFNSDDAGINQPQIVVTT